MGKSEQNGEKAKPSIDYVKSVGVLFFMVCALFLPKILDALSFAPLEKYDFTGLYSYWPQVMPYICLSGVLAMFMQVRNYILDISDRTLVYLKLVYNFLQALLWVVFCQWGIPYVLPIRKLGMPLLYTEKLRFICYLLVFMIWGIEIFGNLKELWKFSKKTST